MTDLRLRGKQIEARIKDAIAEAVSKAEIGKPSEIEKEARAILTRPLKRQAEMLFAPLTAQVIYNSFEGEIKRLKRRRCTEADLAPTIEQIKDLRKVLPIALRKAIDEMRKRLPRHGGPGRTSALTKEQKIDACEQIATMQKTKATSLPDTFEIVAETFRAKDIQVSARTIKRVWENRRELYA